MSLLVHINRTSLRFPYGPLLPKTDTFSITNSSEAPVTFRVTTTADDFFTVSPAAGTLPRGSAQPVSVSLDRTAPQSGTASTRHKVTVLVAAASVKNNPAHKPNPRFAVKNVRKPTVFILPVTVPPSFQHTFVKSPPAFTPWRLLPYVQTPLSGPSRPPAEASLAPRGAPRADKPPRRAPRSSPRPRSPPNPAPHLAARPPPPSRLPTLPGTAGALERRELTHGKEVRPPKAVPSMRPMPSKTANTPPPAREGAKALASTSSASGRPQARGAPLTPPPAWQVQHPDAGVSKGGISVRSRNMSIGTHPIKISDPGPKKQISKRQQGSGIKDDIPEISSTAPTPMQIPATEVARENRELARQIVATCDLPWERTEWIDYVFSWMIENLEEECNAKCSASSMVQEKLVGGVRMRAKTSKGDFMVVAFAGSSGGAAKIGVLGRVVPRYIGRVVCMSESKDAVLMRDYGDKSSNLLLPTEAETVTKDYVWMQMGTIGRTSELAEGGLMDLRPEVLRGMVDNLEQMHMFREMASRKAYEKNVKCFRTSRKRIRMGLTKLIGCGIPETVIGGQGYRKGEGGEHYLFHRWFEGFVGCALAVADGGILEEAVFLKMWSSFGETEKIVKCREIGKCVYWLSLLVMRLEYAHHSEAEPAEREWWLTQAGRALVQMNDKFIETGNKW